MHLVLAQAAAHVEVPAWFWEAFIGGVVLLLFVDLAVFHKSPHEVTAREAVLWTIFWVSLAMAFNGWIWMLFGAKPALDFFTAYVVEESLSVDNLFVFILLFQFFKVPSELKHRVLFFGILGAIVTRLVFIVVGIGLIERFQWLNYVLGAFLVFTAVRLLFAKKEEKDPSQTWVFRTVTRLLPFTPEYHGGRLTVVKDGKRVATMLLLVILVIEATDVAFAVDSIPACIGVTRDKFIVFTSNVCAVLGLRAVFFLLARFMTTFRYLEPGLALVLGFVGAKMFGLFEPSSGVSLLIIASILVLATAASVVNPEEKDDETSDVDGKGAA
jgi:tellurite resistance protein TerC